MLRCSLLPWLRSSGVNLTTSASVGRWKAHVKIREHFFMRRKPGAGTFFARVAERIQNFRLQICSDSPDVMLHGIDVRHGCVFSAIERNGGCWYARGLGEGGLWIGVVSRGGKAKKVRACSGHETRICWCRSGLIQLVRNWAVAHVQRHRFQTFLLSVLQLHVRMNQSSVNRCLGQRQLHITCEHKYHFIWCVSDFA